MTEIHRCFAAIEAFELPGADLARLQAHARRRARDAARRDRRDAEERSAA
jgi:hypothetical protein